MRILLAHPNRNDGTSFYRSIGPFSHLQKHNPKIEVTDVTLLNYNISWATLIHYDMLFYQRPCSMPHFDAIKLAKVCNKPVWVDYDDDVFNVPPHNPRYELYSGLQEYITECLKLADFITVTTESIRDSFVAKVPSIESKITVVPNAYDETIFSNDYASMAPREKIIFWRGGDTHGNDLAQIASVVHELIEKYPEYKWAFLGSAPEWITEYRMDPSRLLIYPFQEIFTYFQTLINLRPEIMIVPLADELFSRGRSNISWIEGTLAGAAVVGPWLPEFNRKGVSQYKDIDSFKVMIENLIQSKSLRDYGVENSLREIPQLASINHLRMEVIAKAHNILSHKIYVRPDENPADDQEQLAQAIINGQTQESPEHVKSYHDLADTLVNIIKPESAVDFGCGTGTLLERLLHNNVVAYGLEKNFNMIEYFCKRNPVLTDYVKHMDFSIGQLTADKFDLGIAIESFESIDQPEEWWYAFIKKLSEQFNYFYFILRPYRDMSDKKYGIVNIRTRAAWQELFLNNGWEQVINWPTKANGFDMLFKRKEEPLTKV